MRSAILLVLPLAVGTLAAQARRPWREADIETLFSVSEPSLRPDGVQLVYVRSRADLTTNANRSEIVLVVTESGRAIAQWDGGSPRWSPNGREIAYAAGRDGRTGIWIRNVEAGTDRLLAATSQTDAWLGRGAAKNFEWSPDGQWIGFVAAEPAGPPPASDVRVFSRIMFKTGTGFTDNRRTHVWVVAAQGGTPRLLTPGSFDEHSIAWAPDSKRLAFISDRSADSDNTFSNDIFVIDVGTGLLSRITETPSAEFSPAWSPDGKWIAFEGWVRTNNTKDSPAEDSKAYVVAAAGGPARRLVPGLDRRITEISWLPAGDGVLFTAGDRGAIHIFKGGLADSLPTLLVGGPAQSRAPSVDPKAARLVFVRSETARPPEVYLEDLGSGRERALTSLNEALRREVALQDAETFWFRSFDGTAVQGWLMKPVGFVPGSKYPLILNIHGGPHSAYGYSFSDRTQQQASAGFGVLYINPRGSIGYGQAFSDGSLLNWGGGDFQDLMNGLDDAIARNAWIDPTRLGVTGGSYGGFMTNWVITQTPRFKAAVAAASISNLISFYGTSLYTDLVEAEFRGLPWKNYGMLWQWSPLAHVEGVTTPTLFLHGENDHDVPITQAEEMYVALRKQGVDATLARYPDEGHGFRQPKHVADSNRRLLDWFEKYLKPSRPATP